MNVTDDPPAHEGVPATPDWLAKLGNEASRIAAEGDAEAAEALLTCAFNTGPGDIGPVGLGRALVQLTLQLDEVARWQALAGVLQHALELLVPEVLQAWGDVVATLEQLAVVAGRAGEMQVQAERLTDIVCLAAAQTGPPDSATANVYLRVRNWCIRGQALDAAVVLEQALLRYILAAPELPDDERAAWLSHHFVQLTQWQRADLIPAQLVLAEAAASIAPWPLTLSVCQLQRSNLHEDAGDWPAAARSLEQALQPAGHLDTDRIPLHSRAARAWFRSGDAVQSAHHSRAAIRLRLVASGRASFQPHLASP